MFSGDASRAHYQYFSRKPDFRELFIAVRVFYTSYYDWPSPSICDLLKYQPVSVLAIFSIHFLVSVLQLCNGFPHSPVGYRCRKISRSQLRQFIINYTAFTSSVLVIVYQRGV